MSVADTVTAFVARLTGRSPADLPAPAEAGDEWLGVLRQRLARWNCGLVSMEHPGEFSWPGHWIGIVDRPDDQADAAAVLLFGTPSAVIDSPDVPQLSGKGVEELKFRQGLLLAEFDPFKQPEVQSERHTGTVEGIYITDVKSAPMRAVPTATALQGRGLAGDRYANGAGTFTPRSNRLRGYDITLIESEVLSRLLLADGKVLAPEQSRRNLVSRGIDLNALVGREFRIGPVRALGQRLCEPCVHLQRLTRAGVVMGLAHRGGLRADLLSDGEIHVGDPIEAV